MQITSEFCLEKGHCNFELIRLGQFFTVDNQLFVKTNKSRATAFDVIQDHTCDNPYEYGKSVFFHTYDRVEPVDVEINLYYE